MKTATERRSEAVSMYQYLRDKTNNKTYLSHDSAVEEIKTLGLPFRFLVERKHHPNPKKRW